MPSMPKSKWTIHSMSMIVESDFDWEEEVNQAGDSTSVVTSQLRLEMRWTIMTVTLKSPTAVSQLLPLMKTQQALDSLVIRPHQRNSADISFHCSFVFAQQVIIKIK